MNRYKISAVVPVYNGSKFLKTIFNSFLSQTYDNFEVFFIDDFSTDNSLEVLKKLCVFDDRFKVLSRDTKGGTAVKGHTYALQYVSGDFFFPITQDDYIDKDYFYKAIECYNRTKAEVLFGNLVLHYADKDVSNYKYPINNDYSMVIEGKKVFPDMLDWAMHANSIRKMSLIKEYGYDDKFYNSCEYWGRLHVFYAKKVAFFDSNYYYNQDNPLAITKGTPKPFKSDVLVTDVLLHNVLVNNGYSNKIINKNKKRIHKQFIYWVKLLIKNIFKHYFSFDGTKYVFNNLIYSAKLLFSK